MRLGVAASVVDGTRIPGDVEVEDGLVRHVGMPPGGTGLAAPGFVDLQVNGFAGVDFLTADAAGYARAGEALAATGVTAYLPTLITAPADRVEAAATVAARAAERADGPRVLGLHLEGPFLSPSFMGAHDPAHRAEPDAAFADRLLAAGPVRLMTLAPERPGGLELVDRLVRRGVTVSLGHTDADAGTAHAAFNRGAAAVTHLHNAMRRWAARDPGVAGVALARGDVTAAVIVDRAHLADETVQGAWRAAAGRLALTTDAIAGGGGGPGTVGLGARRVQADDTAARLADGTLAGSVVTMDAAVRHLVQLGAEPVAALRAAAEVPARLLGRPATLRPGAPADVVVLDDDLAVRRTLVGGRERFAG
jgi:N-acetylglucosamine-6-phosphate deacetylase